MEQSGGNKMSDEKYMELALSLAERGAGRVSPNPMVGAIIVKNGRIIGEGWHARMLLLQSRIVKRKIFFARL